MSGRPTRVIALVALLLVSFAASARAQRQASAPADDVTRLVAAILGDTPLVDDLEALADRIGGRATGSPANARAVEWGIERFRQAGVETRREAFTMPRLWRERSSQAVIEGGGIRFSPEVVAMPFSTGTPPAGVGGPLLDAGTGNEADFARLGGRAKGGFLLIDQPELHDIAGLFREYTDASTIEDRAAAAGAAGVIYIASRPGAVMYRHNVSKNIENTMPMLVMERGSALRAARLLRRGVPLTITETILLETGGSYESHNVIAEIRGASRPEEIVLIGAHLDSWDLGDGALDNGANVSLVIDVARQIRRLGLRPARTIRFALWNGEEQGLVGSHGYTLTHAAELDRHVITLTFDIGCGRLTGFFTGGRPEVAAATERLLAPVAGLGPFQQIDVPVVGTDNFDFMMQGVANLIGNHEPAAYGPNYHASSDTFDKCDTRQLRLNTAIAGALTYGFANDRTTFPRHTRAQIEELVRTTDLPQQMKTFNFLTAWEQGRRGRPR